MVRVMKQALLLLALAGCTVGPDYHLPAQALQNNKAAQAPFTDAAKVGQNTAPPENWWHLFNDPRLDALIPRAFAANTDLRIARDNLERSHALLDQAQVARQIGGTIALETSDEQLSAEEFLHDGQPPVMQLYNTGLSVSYDLDLFGGIRRGIEAARDDTDAAQAARDLVRINVAAETARAYAEICNSGHELDALRHTVSLQNQSLALTQLLGAHGRAVGFDIARQQASVENAKARLPLLEARQLNAAYRLATLIGQPPSLYDHAWLACHQNLQMKILLPVGDGRALLARRPDVRAAERRLAAATARIGVATAALYPDIKLTGSVGSTGAVADAFSPLTNRFGAGPELVWNINPNAARARIKMAEAQTRANLAAFDGTVLTALRETESSLNSYSKTLDYLQSLTAARDHAAEVAANIEALRQGGRVNALVALEAERNLAVADQSVAEAQSAISQRQIAVFLALGGGWGDAKNP